ncbi:MAG: hypothetical protein LBS29_04795 [Endomicrobium sp.]|nr:hypothetical protein [Endomicrobium sp.]
MPRCVIYDGVMKHRCKCNVLDIKNLPTCECMRRELERRAEEVVLDARIATLDYDNYTDLLVRRK